MKIAVLGSGMVGQAIARDLSKSFHVTAFDISSPGLNRLKEKAPEIETRQADLRQYEHYAEWLQPFDLVVTAVPGFMGFETVKNVILSGKNICDISFSPENILDLDELARNKDLTVITDMGVAPGMSNLILGRYNEEMTVSHFECYVGGLPRIRRKPFEYKAPFSPVDVIEEYTRPARLKENGQIVIKPALTEIEYLDFADVGTTEAFNTDGLRSLLFTMPHIPHMKEKTLRYPGHVELIIALQRAGFFNKEEIYFGDLRISPLEFTSKILFDNWKLEVDEEELTLMKVLIKGEKNGNPQRVEYNLLDRFDPVTRISSMSRTTGYTCTAGVHLIAKKLFTKKGVFPPELVGSDRACFDFIMNYLGERNVIWKKV